MKFRHPLRLFFNALKLSRVNNLVIIIITQYFSAYFLIEKNSSVLEIVNDFNFFIMVLSTVIISASGYYINDYYDVKIDLINKPHKVIVGNKIKRRQVMLAHLAFNSVGILLGLVVSYWIGLVNLVAAFLLWLYSNQLKRLPFVGNFVVALLTGATLLTIGIYFRSSDLLLFMYAFFAFGINLIREVIKDIEDVHGDASFGSKSLPVLFGIRKTKWVLYFLIVVYIGAMIFIMGTVNYTILNYYFMLLTLPFTHFTYLLSKADTKKHFSFLSKYCKWIILAGISSMILLKF
ncbi:MAG: geranylgeranylglycerol-phosphate geranylgeranyltransferase [Reichenbachiella sp.]